MIERVELHLPPFDKFNYESFLDVYSKYFCYMDSSISELTRIFLYQINTLVLKRQFLSHEDKLLWDEFFKIYKAKRDEEYENLIPEKRLLIGRRGSIVDTRLFKAIVKKIVSIHLPEFNFDTRKYKVKDSYSLIFSKKMNCEKYLLLNFDRGSKGPGLIMPQIGYVEPFVYILFGYLFVPGEWRYSDEESLESAIIDIITMVKLFVPYFSDEIIE